MTVGSQGATGIPHGHSYGAARVVFALFTYKLVDGRAGRLKSDFLFRALTYAIKLLPPALEMHRGGLRHLLDYRQQVKSGDKITVITVPDHNLL